MPEGVSYGVSSFFDFRSVVVVGASDDASRVGGAPINLLRRGGFDGPIYGVNPKRSPVLGEPCFASIEDVPGQVDLALICIATGGVLDALERLQAKGIRAAAIFTGGFAETGQAGREAQVRIAEFGARHGIAILGPNCAGYISFLDGRTVTFASQPLMLKQAGPGTVALLSQSGGVAFNAWADAIAKGARFSHLVTTGNESNLSFSDFLSYFAAHPDVGAVVGYIEGIGNGPAFCAAAEAMQRADKPLVLLKGGVSDAGQEAARSHTAQLSSSSDAFHAACARYGVIVVETLQEMNDLSVLLSMNIAGKVTLATNSGGAGVYMADLSARAKVPMTDLGQETLARLSTVVPEFGRIRNPVDVTAQIVNDIAILGNCIDILLEDPECDVLVFALTGKSQPEAARTVITAFVAAAERSGKPIVLCWLGVPEETRQAARRAGLVVYPDPSRFLLPAGRLNAVRQAAQNPWEPETVQPRWQSTDRIAIDLGDASILPEKIALDLLAAGGVGCPRRCLVRSAEELVAAASELTFPLVMKISIPVVAHKSDIGGVVTGIEDFEGLVATWSAMKVRCPDLVEVVVAEQVAAGAEVLVGWTRDPAFGARLTLGAGGIWAETACDAVTLTPPFTPSYVRRELSRLACWPALAGARGRPKLAVDSLVDTILGIADVASRLPEPIGTFECNPVIVSERSASVVDAVGYAHRD